VGICHRQKWKVAFARGCEVKKVVSILFALVLALGLCLVMAVPASAGAITSIDVTPVDATAGATSDYSLGFTIFTGEATNVVIDFSNFGGTGTDMDLSGVSTNVAHYTFGGFAVDPSGVTVDNGAAKTVTFTGGTTTGAGAHTIDNAGGGTGLVITNDQDAETQNVVITTTSDTGNVALTIDPAAAHHLKVTGTATMTAGTNNELTITAYDQYDNVCDSGPNNYTGGKTITFSGPADSPDGNTPTVEGTDVGTGTAVNFTNGVSDAGAATLVAYKAEVTEVDADDGTIDSTGDAAWDLDLTVKHDNAANLRVTDSGVMTSGTNNELTVTACDQFGNVADGANGATAYAGAKNLTFAGPGVAPDGTNPTVEGVNIGTATAVNFTAGVSDAGAATLVAYKVELTHVDVDDGTIDSTGSAAWDLDLVVNVAGIDHYAVTAIASPVGVNVPFAVTIQAQDAFNNNIVIGAENITITFGIADAGATPTTTTTAAGTATVNMTMTENVAGQTITFTGVTSGKAGTSNTFFVATFAGGGGGGAAPPSPSGEGSMNIHYFLDADGRATVVITLTSSDGLVTMNIPSGTLALDAQGNPLFNIQIVPLSTPPTPPGYVMVGRAYDCLPDGATFQPSIPLTLGYYESHIPTGASEEDLVLAYWDGEQWVNLPTTVDAAANTATADVAHFTPFALLIEAPAEGAPPEEAPPEEEAPSEEAPAEAEPLNIWIIVGIIAAVIVVGLIVFLLVRRRA
jgi:hypothetical protein